MATKQNTGNTNACVPFNGPISDQGYGRVYIGNGRWKRAHVVAWERVNGPVPAGKQLDHLCRNRACVNLSHLEPVTSRENTLRGEGPTAVNAHKQSCKRGHEFTAENIYWRGHHRECRTCKALARRGRLAA